MNLAFPRFDRLPAAQDGIAPDFAVLLAGLSARQSASATARHQILLESTADDNGDDLPPHVALLVQGTRGNAASCSFSAAVAKALKGDS